MEKLEFVDESEIPNVENGKFITLANVNRDFLLDMEEKLKRDEELTYEEKCKFLGTYDFAVDWIKYRDLKRRKNAYGRIKFQVKRKQMEGKILKIVAPGLEKLIQEDLNHFDYIDELCNDSIDFVNKSKNFIKNFKEDIKEVWNNNCINEDMLYIGKFAKSIELFSDFQSANFLLKTGYLVEQKRIKPMIGGIYDEDFENVKDTEERIYSLRKNYKTRKEMVLSTNL